MGLAPGRLAAVSDIAGRQRRVHEAARSGHIFGVFAAVGDENKWLMWPRSRYHPRAPKRFTTLPHRKGILAVALRRMLAVPGDPSQRKVVTFWALFEGAPYENERLRWS